MGWGGWLLFLPLEWYWHGLRNIHDKFNKSIKADQYLVKYQFHYYYSINSSSDKFYLYLGDVQRPFRSLSLVFKTPRGLL